MDIIEPIPVRGGDDFFIDAAGAYDHYIDGENVYHDPGTLAIWAECEAVCFMPYDLKSYQYYADNSTSESLFHEFFITFSGSFRKASFGDSPSASYDLPSISITLYSPDELAAVAPVPEPETYMLTALGLGVIVARSRRKITKSVEMS
ncbi:PEP-CTERM sorting domain-containing protein [Chitinibacteraceae bacterium HSL-7]